MINQLNDLIKQLKKNKIEFSINENLAKYTTWKIGGPADVLFIAKDIETLKLVIKISKETKTQITIIGGGSNILISDEGIRGLVIINKLNQLKVNNKKITYESQEHNEIVARLNQIDTDKYYDFAELDFDESQYSKTSVYVGSGFYLPQLINVLIEKGITGLQWFAGIPGTIGGAIYNNIHGGSHFISEYIDSVEILDGDLNIKTIPKSQLSFDYDYSSFHNTKDIIILGVNLILNLGDKIKAQKTAMAWAQKKRLQPYRSAGCCFQNVEPNLVKDLNLESGSWGYIIDKILNLKGTKIGDAIISTEHAAFIENLGSAKADDVIQLFNLIYTTAHDKLGIQPKLEIFMLGFDEKTTHKYA